MWIGIECYRSASEPMDQCMSRVGLYIAYTFFSTLCLHIYLLSTLPAILCHMSIVSPVWCDTTMAATFICWARLKPRCKRTVRLVLTILFLMQQRYGLLIFAVLAVVDAAHKHYSQAGGIAVAACLTVWEVGLSVWDDTCHAGRGMTAGSWEGAGPSWVAISYCPQPVSFETNSPAGPRCGRETSCRLLQWCT